MTDDEQKAAGLGALAESLGLAVDPMAILRAEFKACEEATDEFDLTRKDIRRVLDILHDVLDPELQMQGAEVDGLIVVTPHSAMNALETLIDGLDDLDRGLTPPFLKATPGSKGAAMKTAKRKFNETLEEAVLMAKQAKRDTKNTGPFKPGENQTPEALIARMLEHERPKQKNQTPKESIEQGIPVVIDRGSTIKYTAESLRNMMENSKRRKSLQKRARK